MKKVLFSQAIKYGINTDIIVISKHLKEFVKQNFKMRRNNTDYNLLELIADECPTNMKVINSTIRKFFNDIDYIEIMSNAQFFVIDYDMEV